MRVLLFFFLQIMSLRWGQGWGTKLTPNFEFCLDMYFKHYDLVIWIYNWECDMESLRGLYFDHKGTREVSI